MRRNCIGALWASGYPASYDLFVENGLVLRAVGDTMVCAPPLVLSKEEADELVDKAWTCLDLTAKALLERNPNPTREEIREALQEPISAIVEALK